MASCGVGESSSSNSRSSCDSGGDGAEWMRFEGVKLAAITSLPLDRIHYYDSYGHCYVVATDAIGREFRLLKFTKNDTSLDYHLDSTIYTQEEIQRLMNVLRNSKTLQHGRAYAILGCVRFTRGYYLLFVTKRRRAGRIGPHTIYEVANVTLVSLCDEMLGDGRSSVFGSGGGEGENKRQSHSAEASGLTRWGELDGDVSESGPSVSGVVSRFQALRDLDRGFGIKAGGDVDCGKESGTQGGDEKGGVGQKGSTRKSGGLFTGGSAGGAPAPSMSQALLAWRTAEEFYREQFRTFAMRRYMYYSHTYDLTNTLQMNMVSPQATRRPRSKYVWNEFLLEPMLFTGQKPGQRTGTALFPTRSNNNNSQARDVRSPRKEGDAFVASSQQVCATPPEAVGGPNVTTERDGGGVDVVDEKEDNEEIRKEDTQWETEHGRESAYVFEAHQLQQWVVYLMHGCVTQYRIRSLSGTIVLSVIGRVSKNFSGARYLRRGVSADGHVANHVEIEQVVVAEDSLRKFGTRGRFSSYVQVRGSVPIHWFHPPTQLPKPPIKLGVCDPFYNDTRLHFQELLADYGAPVIVMNLLKSHERKPREKLLTNEFRTAVRVLQRYAGDDEGGIGSDDSTLRGLSPLEKKGALPANDNKGTGGVSQPLKLLRYKAFDLRNNAHRAWNSMTAFAEEDFTLIGFFACDEEDRVRLQHGVVRSNCVDCIDRTNLGQFFYGIHALGHQLRAIGIIEDEIDITISQEVQEAMLRMYLVLGDAIAIQYGGSAQVGAGLLHRGIGWDKIMSIKRMYNNAVGDREKQSALNLFLGRYQPCPSVFSSATNHIFRIPRLSSFNSPGGAGMGKVSWASLSEPVKDLSKHERRARNTRPQEDVQGFSMAGTLVSHARWLGNSLFSAYVGSEVSPIAGIGNPESATYEARRRAVKQKRVQELNKRRQQQQQQQPSRDGALGGSDFLRASSATGQRQYERGEGNCGSSTSENDDDEEEEEKVVQGSSNEKLTTSPLPPSYSSSPTTSGASRKADRSASGGQSDTITTVPPAASQISDLQETQLPLPQTADSSQSAAGGRAESPSKRVYGGPSWTKKEDPTAVAALSAATTHVLTSQPPPSLSDGKQGQLTAVPRGSISGFFSGGLRLAIFGASTRPPPPVPVMTLKEAITVPGSVQDDYGSGIGFAGMAGGPENTVGRVIDLAEMESDYYLQIRGAPRLPTGNRLAMWWRPALRRYYHTLGEEAIRAIGSTPVIPMELLAANAKQTRLGVRHRDHSRSTTGVVLPLHSSHPACAVKCNSEVSIGVCEVNNDGLTKQNFLMKSVLSRGECVALGLDKGGGSNSRIHNAHKDSGTSDNDRNNDRSGVSPVGAEGLAASGPHSACSDRNAGSPSWNASEASEKVKWEDAAVLEGKRGKGTNNKTPRAKVLVSARDGTYEQVSSRVADRMMMACWLAVHLRHTSKGVRLPEWSAVGLTEPPSDEDTVFGQDIDGQGGYEIKPTNRSTTLSRFTRCRLSRAQLLSMECNKLLMVLKDPQSDVDYSVVPQYGKALEMVHNHQAFPDEVGRSVFYRNVSVLRHLCDNPFTKTEWSRTTLVELIRFGHPSTWSTDTVIEALARVDSSVHHETLGYLKRYRVNGRRLCDASFDAELERLEQRDVVHRFASLVRSIPRDESEQLVHSYLRSGTDDVSGCRSRKFSSANADATSDNANQSAVAFPERTFEIIKPFFTKLLYPSWTERVIRDLVRAMLDETSGIPRSHKVRYRDSTARRIPEAVPQLNCFSAKDLFFWLQRASERVGLSLHANLSRRGRDNATWQLMMWLLHAGLILPLPPLTSSATSFSALQSYGVMAYPSSETTFVDNAELFTLPDTLTIRILNLFDSSISSPRASDSHLVSTRQANERHGGTASERGHGGMSRSAPRRNPSPLRDFSQLENASLLQQPLTVGGRKDLMPKPRDVLAVKPSTVADDVTDGRTALTAEPVRKSTPRRPPGVVGVADSDHSCGGLGSCSSGTVAPGRGVAASEGDKSDNSNSAIGVLQKDSPSISLDASASLKMDTTLTKGDKVEKLARSTAEVAAAGEGGEARTSTAPRTVSLPPSIADSPLVYVESFVSLAFGSLAAYEELVAQCQAAPHAVAAVVNALAVALGNYGAANIGDDGSALTENPHGGGGGGPLYSGIAPSKGSLSLFAAQVNAALSASGGAVSGGMGVGARSLSSSRIHVAPVSERMTTPLAGSLSSPFDDGITPFPPSMLSTRSSVPLAQPSFPLNTAEGNSGDSAPNISSTAAASPTLPTLSPPPLTSLDVNHSPACAVLSTLDASLGADAVQHLRTIMMIVDSMFSFSRHLESVDLTNLNSLSRWCFFTNVFNALFIHSWLMAAAQPATEVRRLYLCNAYRIGGHVFTLDDIKNGILRGNRPSLFSVLPPFKRGDARLALIPAALHREAALPLREGVWYDSSGRSSRIPEWSHIKNGNRSATRSSVVNPYASIFGGDDKREEEYDMYENQDEEAYVNFDEWFYSRCTNRSSICNTHSNSTSCGPRSSFTAVGDKIRENGTGGGQRGGRRGDGDIPSPTAGSSSSVDGCSDENNPAGARIAGRILLALIDTYVFPQGLELVRPYDPSVMEDNQQFKRMHQQLFAGRRWSGVDDAYLVSAVHASDDGDEESGEESDAAQRGDGGFLYHDLLLVESDGSEDEEGDDEGEGDSGDDDLGNTAKTTCSTAMLATSVIFDNKGKGEAATFPGESSLRGESRESEGVEGVVGKENKRSMHDFERPLHLQQLCHLQNQQLHLPPQLRFTQPESVHPWQHLHNKTTRPGCRKGTKKLGCVSPLSVTANDPAAARNSRRSTLASTFIQSRRGTQVVGLPWADELAPSAFNSVSQRYGNSSSSAPLSSIDGVEGATNPSTSAPTSPRQLYHLQGQQQQQQQQQQQESFTALLSAAPAGGGGGGAPTLAAGASAGSGGGASGSAFFSSWFRSGNSGARHQQLKSAGVGSHLCMPLIPSLLEEQLSSIEAQVLRTLQDPSQAFVTLPPESARGSETRVPRIILPLIGLEEYGFTAREVVFRLQQHVSETLTLRSEREKRTGNESSHQQR